MGFNVIRLYRSGHSEIGDGFVGILELLVGFGHASIGLGVVAIQFNGFFERLKGLLITPLLEKGLTGVVFFRRFRSYLSPRGLAE